MENETTRIGGNLGAYPMEDSLSCTKNSGISKLILFASLISWRKSPCKYFEITKIPLIRIVTVEIKANCNL